MTGLLAVYAAGAPRPRFWKVEVATDGGRRLAMSDPRRLGRIRLRHRPEAKPPLAGLGFDVLSACCRRRLSRLSSPSAGER